MTTNLTMAASGGMSYADRITSGRLRLASRLAVGAADLYVAGATAYGPAEGALSGIMPWASGVAAAGHAIYGIVKVFTETTDHYDSKRGGFVAEWVPRPAKDYAVGSGHLVTAAGFAALAFGLGPWALPIIGIGQATALIGEMVGREG